MAIEFFINSETLHFDDSTPIYIFVAFLNLKSHTHTHKIFRKESKL